MLKYFNNCKNLNDLRKGYLKLIKKYHPDLAKDELEFKKYNEICAEINNEYEEIVKMFPKSKSTKENIPNTLYDYIINNSEEAKEVYEKIEDEISKLTIDYKYYDVVNSKWWEEEVLSELDGSIALFWNVCVSKNIVGNKFSKLFELSDFNVEKMRRTIMFLSTGVISEQDIHANLNANNSIPFLDNNIIIEKLPNYNSFLLLSKENTKNETKEAWVEFCQRQRDNFYEKFNDIIVPKIQTGKQK